MTILELFIKSALKKNFDRETFVGLVKTSVPPAPDETERFLKKILLSKNRALYLRAMFDVRLDKLILPEIPEMRGVMQPPEFHPEGDVLEHTILTVDKIKTKDFDTALAALLHDIGKPPTFVIADRIRFNCHESVGAGISKKILRRLGIDGERFDKIIWLISNHMKVKDSKKMLEKTLKKFTNEKYFQELIALAKADCEASHGDLKDVEYAERYFYSKPKEIKAPPPLITGRDLIKLGFKPGPIFKKIISEIEALRSEKKIKTKMSAIRYIKENY